MEVLIQLFMFGMEKNYKQQLKMLIKVGSFDLLDGLMVDYILLAKMVT
jgi:hypothetical protein